MAYHIEFADSVKAQLKNLNANQRTVIIDHIDKQLVQKPLTETRNKKPLRPNPIAPWELRIGMLRVFYEVSSDEPRIVRILAVGHKKGNKLFIAGQEVKL
jgi:mRNA-degrading endonuclease RelE of RelBE toxin-antitoxin system